MTRKITLVAVVAMLAMGTTAALAVGTSPQATEDVTAQETTTIAAQETTTVAAQETTTVGEEANVTFSEQTSNGTAVVVDEVVVPEGGFVVIHEAESAEGAAETETITTAALDTTVAGTQTTAVGAADQQYTAGAVLGNSTYLEPGTHEDVTVMLDEPLEEDQVLIAMPHLDTNDNQQYEFPEADDPYVADGEAVIDWANVTVEEGATTAEGAVTTTEEDAETTTEEM